MRNKLAKELRRLAREMCEADGAVEVGYTGGTPPEFQMMEGFTIKTRAGVPRKLDKKCIRYFYKYLKGKVK